MNKEYQILLYYQYIKIDNPEVFRDVHKKLCQELDLKGRIIVAYEGINGTVSGLKENTDKYMQIMHNDPLFASMKFKIDTTYTHAFKKMSVKFRNELVNLSLVNDIDPLQTTGRHLKPQDFYNAMQDENTVIIDARNDYEYDLGHFKKAIRPNIKTFRELPDWIKNNKEVLGNKKILTYCTGGVRCEKFSGWLIDEGYDDVSQLDGGIATYGQDKETLGKDWHGKMYVFDNRISVDINKHEHVIVGKDYFDQTPCERYVNCANPSCNIQLLCSEENEHKYMRSCSDECRRAVNNRYVTDNNLSQEDIIEILSKI